MRSIRQLSVLSLALVALGLASCAPSTEIVSFRDPAFMTTRYKHLVVMVDTADLMWRKALESGLVTELATVGIQGIESTSLLAPTRAWSEAQRHDAFVAAGADGIVTLAVQGNGTVESYVPPSVSTTVTSARRDSAHGGGEVQKSTTSTTDGYVERRDWAKFTITLTDLATGRTAWIAMNRLNGGYSQIERFSREVAERMSGDGLASR